MIKRPERIAGFFLKSGIIISCCLGISFQLQSGPGGVMTAATLFKYYTTQSNVWIAAICLILLLIDLLAPNWRNALLQTIKFMFTVSILLTFVVFAVLLAPLMSRAYLLSPSNLFLHNITPLLALADYLICDYHYPSPMKHVFLGLVMPFCYSATVLIASMNGMLFGKQRVPYFFMDYTRLGWFKISDQGIGVVYWISLLLVLLLIMGAGLIKLANHRRHASH